MDIGAVVAALGSLGTILAFVYGIIKKPKSEEDEESSKSTQLTEIKRIIELEKEKINYRLAQLEKDSEKHVTTDELSYLRDDFSKSLKSIEQRLEKMLEIIITWKK